jgi:hypothetical protein
VKVGGDRWRCPIQQIRPIDYVKMRQDLTANDSHAPAG